MIDTLADRLAICSTLRYMLLAVTAAYAHAIDNVSLFCFIAKPASLVGARWARSPVDDVQLAIFPAANAKQKTKDIRLLFLVQLPDILVRTHPIDNTIPMTGTFVWAADNARFPKQSSFALPANSAMPPFSQMIFLFSHDAIFPILWLSAQLSSFPPSHCYVATSDQVPENKDTMKLSQRQRLIHACH